MNVGFKSLFGMVSFMVLTTMAHAAVIEGKIEVAPGAQLYYREAGQGSPVLLIHGAGADADCWFETFDALAKDHRVIAYDRRGYTRSADAPIPSSKVYYHQHAEDAAQLLNALGIQSATVVGWSGGALVTMDLAIHHPEQVSSMVLIEPPYRMIHHPTPKMMLTYAKVQILAKLRGPRAGARAFYRWATSRSDGQVTFDHLPAQMQEAMLNNSKTTLAELGSNETFGDVEVRAINKPTLLVEGALTLPNLRSIMRSLVKLMPQAATVEIPGAGHFIQFDAPEVFTSAVTEYVDRAQSSF